MVVVAVISVISTTSSFAFNAASPGVVVGIPSDIMKLCIVNTWWALVFIESEYHMLFNHLIGVIQVCGQLDASHELNWKFTLLRFLW